MKSSLLHLTFISVLSSTFSLAMDSVESDDEHSSPSVVRTVPRDLEAQRVVNLNEDPPGCTDDYLRWSIAFWGIAEGWIDLGATITMSATTLLSGFSTFGDFSEETRTGLGIAAIVCGGTATFLTTMKAYSLKAIGDRERSLRTVILRSHPQLTTVVTQ